jgi:hypothetical protein
MNFVGEAFSLMTSVWERHSEEWCNDHVIVLIASVPKMRTPPTGKVLVSLIVILENFILVWLNKSKSQSDDFVVCILYL